MKKKRRITRGEPYGTFDIDHYIFNLNHDRGYYLVKLASGEEKKIEKIGSARLFASRKKSVIQRVPDDVYKPGKGHNGTGLIERPYVRKHIKGIVTRGAARAQGAEPWLSTARFILKMFRGEPVIIDTTTLDIYGKV